MPQPLRFLTLVILFSTSLIAGEIVPSTNVVGGLRRARCLGAAFDSSGGKVAIAAVVPGTTAEKIGLRAGDVIVSVDGTAITEPAVLSAAVSRKRAGDTLTVVVRRGEETLTKSGALTPRPLERQ